MHVAGWERIAGENHSFDAGDLGEEPGEDFGTGEDDSSAARGSQRTSSADRGARRTSLITWWPSERRLATSAVPISPVEPVTATFIRPGGP